MPVDVTLTARVPAESTPVPLALNPPLAEPFLVSVPPEKVKVSMPPSLARTTVVPIAATETPVEDICAARFVSAPSVRSALTTMASMPDEVARKSWPVPLRVTDTAKFDGDGVAGLVSIADHVLLVEKAKDCASTELPRKTAALGGGGGAAVTVTDIGVAAVAPVAVAEIVALPAEMAETASVATAGVDEVDAGIVTV